MESMRMKNNAYRSENELRLIHIPKPEGPHERLEYIDDSLRAILNIGSIPSFGIKKITIRDDFKHEPELRSVLEQTLPTVAIEKI